MVWAVHFSGIRMQRLGFIPSPFICKGEERVRVSGRIKQRQTLGRAMGLCMPDTSLHARLHPRPNPLPGQGEYQSDPRQAFRTSDFQAATSLSTLSECERGMLRSSPVVTARVVLLIYFTNRRSLPLLASRSHLLPATDRGPARVPHTIPRCPYRSGPAGRAGSARYARPAMATGRDWQRRMNAALRKAKALLRHMTGQELRHSGQCIRARNGEACFLRERPERWGRLRTSFFAACPVTQVSSANSQR